MGCQKDIAGQIVAQGGDYLLAVKGNQGHLLEDIQQALGQALESDTVAQETVATEEHGHGRVERRTCTASDALEVVGVDEVQPGPRQQLLNGPAQRLLPGRVQLLEVAVE